MEHGCAAMRSDTVLRRGHVVQLDPVSAKNPMFAGCFMLVTEPKSWGAQGFVQALGEDGRPGGAAYYRASWEEMELVGEAAWVPDDED
jgi:hypothetical protein